MKSTLPDPDLTSFSEKAILPRLAAALEARRDLLEPELRQALRLATVFTKAAPGLSSTSSGRRS